MPFVFGTQARVWFDGKQGGCSLNELSLEAELDEAETTTLCSTIKDYIPGLAETTVEMEGFFDTDTASPATTLESWFEARLGTTFPITFAPDGGGDIGDPAYLMNGFIQEYTIENTIDEAAALEMTMRCSSSLARGLVVHSDLTPKTATGNFGNIPSANILDNTTSTAFGGVGVLQVSAVSGTTPALVAAIQHSSDGSTWADLIVFSSQNSVNGEYATVTGTVNRYIRARWAITGTTPSFNFNMAFKRNMV